MIKVHHFLEGNNGMELLKIKKKGGGANLGRTQSVSVRLDPKLRFALELAGRKQRRTTSNFIECAIDDALKNTMIPDSMGGEEPLSDLVNRVWDVDEADRVINLGLSFSDLLTHDEARIWKRIQNTPEFRFKEKKSQKGKHLVLKHTDLDLQKIRKVWEPLKLVATEEADEKVLKDAIKKYKAK